MRPNNLCREDEDVIDTKTWTARKLVDQREYGQPQPPNLDAPREAPPVKIDFPEVMKIDYPYKIVPYRIDCDSIYKSASSNLSSGKISFNVQALNLNRAIGNITAIELFDFYIPLITNPATRPDYFFFGQVYIEVEELNSQSFYGSSNFKYHFDCSLTFTNQAVLVQPKNRRFQFAQPITSLDTLTFAFKLPPIPKVVAFPQDVFDANAVPGSNPAEFTTTVPHGLGIYVGAPPALTAAHVIGGGALSTGSYSYVVTFVNSSGETDAGTISNVVPVNAGDSMNLTNIPLGQAGVTARRIYRTVANGSVYLLLTQISDNVTTTYLDVTADANLGAGAPTSNTTGTPFYSVYIQGFASGLADLDNTINSTDGHLVSVVNTTTLKLNNTPGADFTTVATPVPARLIVAKNRVAISVIFYSVTTFANDGSRLIPSFSLQSS
jgi:hypothetical protein